MNKRRQFLQIVLGWITAIGFNKSRLLHAGKEPLTPLKEFGTMGLTDYEADIDRWRLEISGRVISPFHLTYSEIISLPSFEKEVLLNCPGFFFNRGQWKGVSMKTLLEKAGVEKGANQVSFSGPRGQHEKVAEFPMEHILSDRVFLAYGVNGQTLPQKHGFPLRVVAASYAGDEWVKYVYKMKII
jgi:sulfoxide reductase catalytic subunit YedY